MMTYNGYSGAVRFNDEAEIFHGEVLGLRDAVTFQGVSVEELKDSIDDHLDYCEEQPDKPFSGKFVLRIDPTLPRSLYELSTEEGESLNG